MKKILRDKLKKVSITLKPTTSSTIYGRSVTEGFQFLAHQVSSLSVVPQWDCKCTHNFAITMGYPSMQETVSNKDNVSITRLQ